MKEQLLDMGIDSTWNDNNEFEIWDTRARADGFGSPLTVGQIRPILSLLMMKASWEAQREFYPDTRPYLISRSGCPGMQRYVQTWSGDNYTSFETLKYNVKMGLGLSLSGIYNIGHDVGGFSGNKPDAELFVRWVQQGIFWPRFTIHSWNDDGTVNEPWMYPEILPAVKKMIDYRHRITPYIYTLLHRAHRHYEPMVVPPFYHYEEDRRTLEESDDFMLGDSMLVVSVVEQGQSGRSVYLPEDSRGWYDPNDGRFYCGGQKISLEIGYETLPVLIRGGSIIPVNLWPACFEEKDRDRRGFEIYPVEEGLFSYSCYEDDGESNDYLKGIFSHIHVDVECTAESIVVSCRAEGEYPVELRKLDFLLPPGKNGG